MKSSGVNSRAILNWAFYAYLFMLPFQRPVIEIGQFPISIADAFYLPCLTIFLIQVFRRRVKIEFNYLYALLGLYLLSILLSEFLRPAGSPRSVRLASEFYLASIAFLTANVVTDMTAFRQSARSLIAGTLIPIVLGSSAFIFFYFDPNSRLVDFALYHIGAAPAGNYLRITSTFSSPAMFCSYLTLAAALVICSLEQKWLSRSIALMALVIFGAICGLTVTVAIGGLVLVIGIAYKYLHSGNRTGSNKIAAVISILIASGFFVTSICQISDLIEKRQITSSGRIAIWEEAINNISAKPFFGVGIGMPVVGQMIRNSDGTFSYLTDAHDTLLNIAGESGLAAALLFAVFNLALFFRTYYEGKGSGISTILCIAWLAIVGFQGLTSSLDDARHIWILFGMMLGISAHRKCIT